MRLMVEVTIMMVEDVAAMVIHQGRRSSDL